MRASQPETDYFVFSLRAFAAFFVAWPAHIRRQADMRTAKAIREDLDEIRDELTAIVNLATKEERELSDDEQSRADEITAQIDKLNAALENRQKIDAEIKAAAAARLSAKIDSQEAELEGARNAQSKPSLDNIKIPARAKSHHGLKAFSDEKDAYVAGHLLLAALKGRPDSIEFCNRHGLSVQNTMSGGISGGAGGFLVPDEMERAIVRLREERGVFERDARSIPMGSDNITVPRLISDVTSYWVGETDEITASDASLGAAELIAKKLACLTKVSTELDEDAVVEVGDMITTSMAYAMADKMDEAGFNGDGTSTYGGVLGLDNALNSAAVVDAAASNDSALELDLADFEAVVGKLPAYPGMNAKWYMHKAVFWASARRLMDAAGGNTISDLASSSGMNFLGYPVEFVQVMPSTTGTLASTIVAYFGDLGLAATVGTRRGIQTRISEDRYFENDLIGIRCTQRIAINVHERGDTVRTRPIVALKTAS